MSFPTKVEYRQLEVAVRILGGKMSELGFLDKDGAGPFDGAAGGGSLWMGDWKEVSVNVSECREGLLPLTFSLMNKDSRLHLLSLQDLRTGGGGQSAGLWIWAMSRALSPQAFAIWTRFCLSARGRHPIVFINTSVTVLFIIIIVSNRHCH